VTDSLTGIVAGGGIVALPIALVAGVVSGLNPCCLPLYPAAAGCCTALRRDTIRGNLGVAVGFVLGVSAVTTALGLVSGMVGSVFGGIGRWPFFVVAAVPLVLGLHLLDAIELPLPKRVGGASAPSGVFGAALAGALLGLVITPCATPALAGLLAYVATTRDAVWGGVLMFVYGLGLGIPILVLTTTAASLVSRLATPRAQRWSQHATGATLIGVSLYLLWIA
jgi:cytochrome c-type biogenesis protein